MEGVFNLPKVILTGQSNGASNWDAIEDKPNFATVATSGKYSDLTGTPTSLPASDVPSWAKAASKPNYTAAEVGAVPTTRTVNGKTLSSNITLSASDVGAANVNQISNPNLFVNWYFINPINQRGKTEYPVNKNQNGYTIDRWDTFSNVSGSKVIIDEPNGIRLTRPNTSSAVYFLQRFDSILYQQELSGKKLTFSILTDSGVYSSTFVAGNGTRGMITTPFGRMYQEQLGGTHNFVFSVDQYPQSNTILSKLFIAAKLELGDTQTLAHQDASGNWVLSDPPPDKALELAKCQRYYQRYGISGLGINGIGAFSGKTANLFIPTPVTMRTNPAVSISGEFDTWLSDGDSISNNFNYSGSGKLSNNGITVNGITLDYGYGDSIGLLFPNDDGLIELSADL